MGCCGSKGASDKHATQPVAPASKFVKEELAEQPTNVNINAAHEFKVVLQRKSENEKLGMRLTPQKTFLLVKGFKDSGLALAWNTTNTDNPDQQIRPGDIIVSVNGVTQNTEEMMKQFEQKMVDMAVLHPGGTVFVKNLDCDFNDSTLYTTLSSLLKSHASVPPDTGFAPIILSCKLPTDSSGKCRGHGFVYFKTEADAKQAAEVLNGLQIGSKTVEATVAQDLNLTGDEAVVNAVAPKGPDKEEQPDVDAVIVEVEGEAAFTDENKTLPAVSCWSCGYV